MPQRPGLVQRGRARGARRAALLRRHRRVAQPDAGRPGRGGASSAAREAPGRDRIGAGFAATATNNPPLYYLPQALVYRAAHGVDVTGRLAAMRAFSALLAALTALCVFLFVRELLPGSPLAWTVGGLAAGLQPMFAFISSGVNNDAGLYLAAAALFLAVARVLRRGLTPGRAAAVGPCSVARRARQDADDRVRARRRARARARRRGARVRRRCPWRAARRGGGRRARVRSPSTACSARPSGTGRWSTASPT